MRYAPNKGLAARADAPSAHSAGFRFLWSLTLDDLGVQAFANIVSRRGGTQVMVREPDGFALAGWATRESASLSNRDAGRRIVSFGRRTALHSRIAQGGCGPDAG
jgi:hypothetical protein